MNKLDIARHKINEIDKQMAQLFEMRMDAAKLVAEYKRENGLAIDDFSREHEIIEKNSLLIENEDYRPYYVNFLRENIELSKKLQHRVVDGMRVAFSGVKGAFAGIVAQKIFPDAVCVPFGDFSAAYESVVSGECDCAVLPIENSSNGDVGNVLDLAFFGSLYINGIYESEIVQNLLANKGAKLSDIKQVISHPQALGQCSVFIREHGLEKIEEINTAVAAKYVAESGRNDIAAIASLEAAAQFGLVNIAPHINDKNSNTTRFAVFSRSRREERPTDNHFVMLFTVKNVAGALGKAVSVMGDYGFNLRAIKSRPTKALVWNYYFYVEAEGCVCSENGQKMLSLLKDCCDNLRIIGSFEKEVIL